MLGAKKLLVVVALGVVALFGKVISWFTGNKKRELASDAVAPPPTV